MNNSYMRKENYICHNTGIIPLFRAANIIKIILSGRSISPVWQLWPNPYPLHVMRLFGFLVLMTT
jgi:hypothetical protein